MRKQTRRVTEFLHLRGVTRFKETFRAIAVHFLSIFLSRSFQDSLKLFVDRPTISCTDLSTDVQTNERCTFIRSGETTIKIVDSSVRTKDDNKNSEKKKSIQRRTMIDPKFLFDRLYNGTLLHRFHYRRIRINSFSSIRTGGTINEIVDL